MFSSASSYVNNWTLYAFVLLSAVKVGFSAVNLGNSLKTRLSELPERFDRLTSAIFPDGIPRGVIDYYAPRHGISRRCSNDSAIYAEGLGNYTRWAVQMWDSSGKIPSGMLQGNFYDLGNFQECLQTAKISPFEVQHCIVQFGNFMRSQKPPKNWGEVDTVVGGVPVLKDRFNIGFCLPSACDQGDLIHHFRTAVDHLNLSVHMNKYSCTGSDEEFALGSLDKFAIVFVFSVLALVGVATIVDVYFHNYPEKGLFRDLIIAFSSYKNTKYLLKTSDTFSSIDGIRFLSVVWVMISHHCLFDVMRPALNYIEMSELFSKPYASFVLNGTLGVDNFIIINGVLLTYYFMLNMSTGIKFNLPLFYLHRIIRVLPAYATQILITMTIFPWLVNGPLWKNFIQRHTEDCYENWWTNLLFINNYVRPNHQCIPSSWYLSVDMQLYFLSPLILFPVFKWRNSAKLIIPGLIVVGNIAAFLVSWINKYPAGSVIANDYSTVEKHAGVYIVTHTRFGQWAVGIGLGYILFSTRGKQIRLQKNTVKLLWILAVLCGCFIIQFITYFHQTGVPYNRLLSSAYSGFGSTIWAFSIAWVIFACEKGYGGPVATFLSWKFFQPLSTLTYIIYLLHVGVQYGLLGNTEIPNYVEIPIMIRDTFGEILMSVLLAPGFSLAFELPYINMERILRKRYMPTKQVAKAEAAKIEDEKKKENLNLVHKTYVE